MNIWLNSLGSVLVVNLISLVGVFFVALSETKLKQILLFLVSFAAGGLLGDAFLHLLPEATANGFSLKISLAILAGILLFFVLEKFIHWRHCHVPTSAQHPHPLVLMNLVGDGLHSFIDGMILSGSFMIDLNLGLATFIAVVLHEIPQKIGDFGVLIHGGLGRNQAIMLNFAFGLTAFGGAIIVLLVGQKFFDFSSLIVPLTAGGFLYIAGSDLIPELHKETSLAKSFLQMVGLILGISVMLILLILK